MQEDKGTSLGQSEVTLHCIYTQTYQRNLLPLLYAGQETCQLAPSNVSGGMFCLQLSSAHQQTPRCVLTLQGSELGLCFTDQCQFHSSQVYHSSATFNSSDFSLQFEKKLTRRCRICTPSCRGASSRGSGHLPAERWRSCRSYT